MYCIHPIQAGRLPVFLNKPENKTKGRITIGVIELTDFASVTMLPKRRPRDIPAKEMR